MKTLEQCALHKWLLKLSMVGGATMEKTVWPKQHIDEFLSSCLVSASIGCLKKCFIHFLWGYTLGPIIVSSFRWLTSQTFSINDMTSIE